MRSDAQSTEWSRALGRAMRRRRNALELNQDQLGAIAGCGRVFISDAELGKPTLRLDKLIGALRALGLQLTIESGSGGVEIRVAK